MRYVTIISGGMDSGVLAHFLLEKGHTLNLLTFDYGQRHLREITSAFAVTEVLKDRYQDRLERHEVAKLEAARFLFKGSSQTGDVAVPHGRYDAASMKATVVPNRNMVFLSMAIAWAVSLKCDGVVYGAHAGDHTIYPDCRPEFVEAMQKAARLCDWHRVELLAPFVKMTKGHIAFLGRMLGFPFDRSWTCYEGLRTPCGKCGACVERAEAFAYAGIVDPLLKE